MSSGADVVDLFAGGGGGWDLAARDLGLTAVGLETDAPSCATRAAVGLLTIRADVATYPPERFIGVAGLCGSPPCQSYSSAGKGAGLADPRGQLVYEPMRYVRVIQPRWVALEQVPEVLGYWRWIARELREMGYSVWTGILNAASYGVPQIRKRAILLASLDRQVQPPAPTHSKTGHDEMFGPGRLRYVTMADALGWGLTERPAYVVAGGGNGTDGGRHDGGSRQRAQIARHRAEGRWRLRGNQNSALGDGQTVRYSRAVDRPAQTITTNTGAWCWERPATTIPATFANAAGGGGMVAPPGHHTTGTYTADKGAIPVTIAELGVLQGFPADHPWQAPSRAAQVGNAIPPPLAEACLRALVML